MTACSLHPEQPAAFRCPTCDTHPCAKCVDHRWTGKGFADLCRTCQAELAPLSRRGDAPGAGPPPGARAYLSRLPRFAAFPFQRNTLVILLWVAVTVWALQWLRVLVPGHLGILALIFSLAADVALYIHLVTRTGLGKEALRPEDFDDLRLSVIAPATRYALALVPLLLGLLWHVYEHASLQDLALLGGLRALASVEALLATPGPALLIAVSLLLLPLLTIIAAVGSARSVIDPRMWLVALRGIGPTYPAGVLAFYAVWIVEQAVWLPLLDRGAAALSIPVLTPVAVLFLSYLPMALRARLLGGIIEPHRAHFE